MRTSRGLLVWVVAGALGLAFVAWAYPQALSLVPRGWTICRDEAVAIALERLRDLGEPVPDPYLVAVLDTDFFLERRLSTLPDEGESDPRLRAQVVSWLVYVYNRGDLQPDWTYQARVSLSGDLLALRFRPDPQGRGPSIPIQQARDRADAFLLAQGIDPSLYFYFVRPSSLREGLDSGHFAGVEFRQSVTVALPEDTQMPNAPPEGT